jgi:hypothetical protein
MMDMIGDKSAVDGSALLKAITVAAELPLRQLAMANVRRRRDHPGEPRIERRPCGTGFTVSQLGTNGSRFADRIPGGDVIKFALNSLVVPRAVAMHRRRHAIYHKML